MPRTQQPLYVGTSRFVAAIDPRRGEELWRTKLSSGGTGYPVTILIKGPFLYVGHHGHVYCLDKRNGSVLWENGLAKMGYHSVLLAMEGAEGSTGGGVATVTADQHRRRRAAAGVAAGAGAAT